MTGLESDTTYRYSRRDFLKLSLITAPSLILTGVGVHDPPIISSASQELQTLIYFPGIGGFLHTRDLEKAQEQARTSGFNLTLADVPKVDRPDIRTEYIAATVNQIRNCQGSVSLLGSSLGGGAILMLLDSEKLTFCDGSNKVDTTYLFATRNLFNPGFAGEINYQDQTINDILKDFYRVIETPENILNNIGRIVISHGSLDQQVAYLNSQKLHEVFKQSGRCKLILFDAVEHMDIVSNPDLFKTLLKSVLVEGVEPS